MPKQPALSAARVQVGLIEIIERGERTLTVPEVAAVLGLTPGSVYRLCRSHAIPNFRVGGSVRFHPRRLSEWMRGQVCA